MTCHMGKHAQENHIGTTDPSKHAQRQPYIVLLPMHTDLATPYPPRVLEMVSRST